MSTRSLIGQIKEDGKIESIYCHFDGYVDHVGSILKNSYSTQERVDALIGLGWLSSLQDAIDKDDRKTCECCGHTPSGITEAVHRDRGESLRIDEFESLEYYNNNDLWYSYMYLWRDKKWWVKVDWKYVDKEEHKVWYELEDIIENDFPSDRVSEDA